MNAFFVAGRPGPKGSRTATRYGGSRPASKFEAPWIKAVQELAAEHPPLDPPYTVSLSFRFAPGKKNKYAYPVVADLDKLTRSTIDGLVKGSMLTDDAHVIRIYADVDFGPQQGCYVRVVSGETMGW